MSGHGYTVDPEGLRRRKAAVAEQEAATTEQEAVREAVRPDYVVACRAAVRLHRAAAVMDRHDLTGSGRLRRLADGFAACADDPTIDPHRCWREVAEALDADIGEYAPSARWGVEP